ncbi:MAG TPA: LamG-like jellyroll fold domain-containing protein, partial [Roseiflexaceae bacterium]
PAPWEDVGRPAIDRSANRNQLFPGGVLATYQPQPTTIAERLLPSPAQAKAEVLALGSPDHRLNLLNPAGHGLGYYERLTLQLWFKAENPGIADRKQLLFTQGDAEIGLSIYLHGGRLHIYAWQTEVDTGALLRQAGCSAAVTPARWYQVTFISDETAPASAEDPARPQVAFRAYLDQAELTIDGAGFRLNQNGDARLASLAGGAYARFADGEPGDGSHHFAGRLADLRIWGRALSSDEIAHPEDAFHPRHAPPLASDELICYLPLTDGYGWPVNHHAGPRYAPAPAAALEIPRIYDQTANHHDGVFSAGPDDPALKWGPTVLPIAPEGPRLPWLTDLGPAAHRALIERDGTATEVSWAESVTPMTDRPALLIDGDDDQIALPFFRLRSSGTIELWARFIRERDQVLFDASRGDPVEAQRRLFAADLRDGHLRFRVQADDGTIVESGAIDLAALPARFNLEWHHVAASWQYDGAQQQLTARLFLDGQAGAPAVRMPLAAPPALAGLSIGANRGDHPLAINQPLQGQIIQARIWSIVRTEGELRALADATLTGEEAGLLAYLPLDEGQGTLLHNRARYATLQLADPSSAPAHWVLSGAGDPSDLAIDLNPAALDPKRGQSTTPAAPADYVDTPYEIGDEGTIELWFKCQRGRDQVLFDASNDAGGKDGLR